VDKGGTTDSGERNRAEKIDVRIRRKKKEAEKKRERSQG
jgi:hypothetical protein